jgi:isopropylmalate/homocitrate/citramalate synthase
MIEYSKFRKPQWYVSPWDFYPEVTDKFRIAPKVKIHDVTLREGEQQTGVVFNRDDKVAIARKLAELGVDRIEAGMPAVSQGDADAVKAIVDLNLGPEIFAFCRCMSSDIELAKKAGCKGAVLEIACNPIFVKAAYGKTMDWVKKAAIEATIAAKELGMYVSFFTIDGTRTEIDNLLDTVDEIKQGGKMDAFVMADTFGCVHPQSVFEIVTRVKKRFPSTPVEAHMHMHFGLGAANTLAAVAAGAEVAHVAVSGIGEGSGNTPLEDVVLSLKCLYGIETKVKTEKFVETSKFVCKLTNDHPLPPNRPIVGRDVFIVESGIGVMFFENAAKVGDPFIAASIQPELVGQPGWSFALGKKSGLFSIDRKLREIGKTLEPDQKEKVLAMIKELAIREKRLITIEEFKKFVDQVSKKA